MPAPLLPGCGTAFVHSPGQPVVTVCMPYLSSRSCRRCPICMVNEDTDFLCSDAAYTTDPENVEAFRSSICATCGMLMCGECFHNIVEHAMKIVQRWPTS